MECIRSSYQRHLFPIGFDSKSVYYIQLTRNLKNISDIFKTKNHKEFMLTFF